MRKTRLVTFCNEFHNTSVKLRLTCNYADDGKLIGFNPITARQMTRARRELCGHAECLCYTFRGKQTFTEQLGECESDKGDPELRQNYIWAVIEIAADVFELAQVPTGP